MVSPFWAQRGSLHFLRQCRTGPACAKSLPANVKAVNGLFAGVMDKTAGGLQCAY
jgi:hypothetical protein